MLPISSSVNSSVNPIIAQRIALSDGAQDDAATPATCRILLCMDDRRRAQFIYEFLVGLGHEVNCVWNARDVHCPLLNRWPELVILGLHSAEATTEVLSIAETAHVPVPVFRITQDESVQPEFCRESSGILNMNGVVSVNTLQTCLSETLTRLGRKGEGSEKWQAIVTNNPYMESVVADAQLIASSDVSVLIHGDTGTGKKLLARTIHAAGSRAGQSFVAINCAAVSEAELAKAIGSDDEAAGQPSGTLFLDGVGELSAVQQVMLLRRLQHIAQGRTGAPTYPPSSLRILSATSTDLKQSVSDGVFREDLYYLLNVVNLRLPPLSQRREDIPLLARHFIAQTPAELRQTPKKFSPQALQRLATAPWPGNVLQLSNTVQQIVSLSSSPLISEQQVCRALRVEEVPLPKLCIAKREFEHDYIVRVMRIVSGNVTRAARLAGRNRTEFYKLLDKHGLYPDMFKTA